VLSFHFEGNRQLLVLADFVEREAVEQEENRVAELNPVEGVLAVEFQIEGKAPPLRIIVNLKEEHQATNPRLLLHNAVVDGHEGH
jgi:hypothetical protein